MIVGQVLLKNRTAIYTRISTNDTRQNLENQLAALRAYAERNEWTIAAEYSDMESGAEPDRPGLEQMFAAASRGEFERLLVWDLSRLTRRGPANAFVLIERLTSSGVEFWSLQEEFFRTAGPAGKILIAVIAYVAEYERTILVQRIKAGVAEAKRKGKVIGRPTAIVDRTRVYKMADAGISQRVIASKLGISKSTVGNLLRGRS